MTEKLTKWKEKNLKLTPQRLAILDYLEGNTSHPSAQEIYAALKKRYPSLSLATVYNTLDTLKKMGEVQEITIDADRKRFDPNPDLHHHFMCANCHRIVDIFRDFDLTPKFEEAKVYGYQINFYGLCQDCAGKTK